MVHVKKDKNGRVRARGKFIPRDKTAQRKLRRELVKLGVSDAQLRMFDKAAAEYDEKPAAPKAKPKAKPKKPAATKTKVDVVVKSKKGRKLFGFGFGF